MAEESLDKKLEELHDNVIEVVTTRMKGEVVSNDDVRLALAVLKQNGYNAPVGPAVPDAERKARLASKLNFQGIQEKRGVVLPFSAPESPAAQSHQPPAPAA
jgi:hypothetical protein